MVVGFKLRPKHVCFFCFYHYFDHQLEREDDSICSAMCHKPTISSYLLMGYRVTVLVVEPRNTHPAGLRDKLNPRPFPLNMLFQNYMWLQLGASTRKIEGKLYPHNFVAF